MGAHLSLSAPAKINLSLRVGAENAKNYHEIASLVGFASIADQLDLEKAETPSLHVRPENLGPENLGPKNLGAENAAIETADNLVWRAHKAMQNYVGAALPVAMVLQKNLPIAGGLGGGSADAAACLLGLNQLFELKLPPATLQKLAAPLGADIAVCLTRQPHFMRGIGDKLTPHHLPPADILLVNPQRPLETATVFARFEAQKTSEQKLKIVPPPDFSALVDLVDYLKTQGNDLTPAASALVPEIALCCENLAALPQCLYAAMSGSGASCFALFEKGYGAVALDNYRRARPARLGGIWRVNGQSNKPDWCKNRPAQSAVCASGYFQIGQWHLWRGRHNARHGLWCL